MRGGASKNKGVLPRTAPLWLQACLQWIFSPMLTVLSFFSQLCTMVVSVFLTFAQTRKLVGKKVVIDSCWNPYINPTSTKTDYRTPMRIISTALASYSALQIQHCCSLENSAASSNNQNNWHIFKRLTWDKYLQLCMLCLCSAKLVSFSRSNLPFPKRKKELYST